MWTGIFHSKQVSWSFAKRQEICRRFLLTPVGRSYLSAI